MILSNRLKTVLLKDIKPYKNNIRDHTPEQVERIKQSIEANEYLNPISIDKNNEIVAGHGRYLALQLIDNQLSNLSSWNEGNLTMELKNIYTDIDAAYDTIMDEMGLEESFIDDMMSKDRGDFESKKKPESKDGAVKHRYTCPFCKKSWVKGEEPNE